MDLSNKNIDIDFMSSNFVEGTTTLTVSLTQEIAEGVRKTLGTYKLDFWGDAYTSMNDPKLIEALKEKLESLPEPA
jgi:hypothetical protein